MKLKVTFNNETHKLSKLPEDFQSLTQLISKIFLIPLPEHWSLEYFDTDGDKITLADDQDYKELLGSEDKDLNKNFAVKLFVVPKESTTKFQIQVKQDIIECSSNKSDESFQVIDPTKEVDIISFPNSEAILKEEEPILKEEVQEETEKSISLNDTSVPQSQEIPANIELKFSQTQNEEPERPIKRSKSLPKDFKSELVTEEPKDSSVEQKVTEEKTSKDADDIYKIATITLKELKESAKAPMKPQKRPQPLKQVKEKAVHSDIACDGCKVFPLAGIRYKCSVCPDFDFCEKCERKRNHPHAFIKIKYPGHIYLPKPDPFMLFQTVPIGCPFMQFSQEPQENVCPSRSMCREKSTKNMNVAQDNNKMDKPVTQGNKQVQEKPSEESKQFRKVSQNKKDEVIISDETNEKTMKDSKKMSEKNTPQMPKDEKSETKAKDEMKSSKTKKKYSNDMRNKAKQLKDFLPGNTMEDLLSILEDVPEDLDLIELIANFRC